jgi:hypothetical protein
MNCTGVIDQSRGDAHLQASTEKVSAGDVGAEHNQQRNILVTEKMLLLPTRDYLVASLRLLILAI